MSRKIKFRVWDIPNQCWSDLFHAITEDGVLWHFPNSGLAERDDPEQYIVEQYTGLTDKNGKEIYAGDIVEYDWYIVGDKPAYRVNNVVIFDYKGGMVGNDMIWECTNVEVIGNIHEHPELLRGEK